MADAIATQVDAFIPLAVLRLRSFVSRPLIVRCDLYFHLFCVCLTTDCFTFTFARGEIGNVRFTGDDDDTRTISCIFAFLDPDRKTFPR